jgi:two-component SAPR family response regulator
MKVMLVDDEQPMLNELAYWLGKYPDVEILAAFTRPLQAVGDIKARLAAGLELPEVVFLDMEMPQSNGLETARSIQTLHPDIIVIYVTAHSSYALQSFDVHPLDYLLKPLQASRFEVAMKHIRKQFQLLQTCPQDTPKKLYVKCFGSFQLLLPDNAEVKWGTKRVKDLFLYLINRGEVPASHHELINAVFGSGDSKHNTSNLYVTIHKLRKLLQHLDPNGECLRLKSGVVLEIAPGVCDYTDFVKFSEQNPIINPHNADVAAAVLKTCRGVYLSDLDYPWVDQSTHEVEMEYERIALALANFYLNLNACLKAEKLLLDLLARNPLSEDGFNILLDMYIKNNQPRDFGVIYEQYALMLKKELGEEPPLKYSLYHANHCV